MGLVALIVALSLRGAWTPILKLASAARPHAPDMVLFAAQSPAIKIHLATALAALVISRRGALESTRHVVAGVTT